MSSKKKSKTIHFVNARPASETERLDIQRLVRAHVGRWISHQTKEKDPVADRDRDRHRKGDPSTGITPISDDTLSSQTSVTSSRSSRSSLSSRSGASEPSDSSPRCAPKGIRDDDDDENDNDAAVAASALVRVATSSQAPAQETGPPVYMDNVGAGYLDPFNTFPSTLSREVVQASETYCLSVLWPTLTPSSPKEPGSIPASSSWFPLSLHDPTLFTAFLFGSLSHQRIRWANRAVPEDCFTSEDKRNLHLCEMESIKLINRAVQDPSRAVSDAVILSVLCMSHSRADGPSLHASRESPFRAPLARLQWLDVYGSLFPNIVHVRGLILLVRMRGGLENITLPGLAPVISLSDVLISSVFLSPPMFGYLPLEADRRGLSMPAMLGFAPTDVDAGFGKLQDIGFTREMAEVFHAMRIYVAIVDQYMGGKLARPDLSLITDQRNVIQHTLLSLPPVSQLPYDAFVPSHIPHHRQQIIYEACRLGALIFGVGVTFPLPAQTSPLGSLARFLRALLRGDDVSISDLCATSLNASVALLWTLTLGGIAASGQPDRAWFVDALVPVAQQLGCTSWPGLKRVLEMMIWYDTACDEPAQVLWMEVEQQSWHMR